MGDTFAGILAAAAIIAALVVIGKTVIWLWDVLRKLARLADDLTGEPPRPGFPEGRPGVLDRLDAIEKQLSTLPAVEVRLAAVEKEFHSNGGDTLRDAVDRMAPTEPASIDNR